MIDLHTHSTYSDGFFSPQELVKQAQEIGLEALALTDHDAVSGLEELEQAAKGSRLEIVSGAELTVDYPQTDMEIITLDIPKKSIAAFLTLQKEEIKYRKSLALKRLEILQKNGFNITYEDIAYDPTGKERQQIRRPHFVDVLLRKGYIKDIEEAYQKIFAKDGICHIESLKPPVKEIIGFIKENGARAILAHPIHTKHTGAALYELIKELKGYGLDGIEVLHSSHTLAHRQEYLGIIKDLRLITAGGSDYHGGTAHPENKLGTGNKNNLNIPYFVLEVLRERITPSASYYQELVNYL